MAEPSPSPRPAGLDRHTLPPTINITSSSSGSTHVRDHTIPSHDQGSPEPSTTTLAAQKMVRRADEQESSADERTGLFADAEVERDYAGVAGSSSRPPVLSIPAGGSTRKKKRKKPASLNATVPEQRNKSWLRSCKDKYGSIELENVGSTARDHLALERTFLAWLRTSLSFASIGIAVTQLFRLNTNIGSPDPTHPAISHLRKVGKPLGATFIAIAIMILFIGFHRYFESQHYIIRGKFPASRGSVFFVALLAFSLSTVSLVVILTVGGTSINTGT